MDESIQKLKALDEEKRAAAFELLGVTEDDEKAKLEAKSEASEGDMQREMSRDEVKSAEKRQDAARKDLKDVQLGKNGAVSTREWKAWKGRVMSVLNHRTIRPYFTYVCSDGLGKKACALDRDDWSEMMKMTPRMWKMWENKWHPSHRDIATGWRSMIVKVICFG